MAASDDGAAEGEPRRLIYRVRERVHEARAELRSEMYLGRVSVESKKNFASVLLVYYDVLKEHRDEQVLDPPWSERGVDWLDRAARQTVTSERSRAGVLPGTETETRSRLATASADQLLDAGDALDSIAKDLGFGAETPDHTPQDELELSNLLGLMSVRGQDAATEVYDALDVDLGGGDEPDDTGD
jgi:hypothetical protein